MSLSPQVEDQLSDYRAQQAQGSPASVTRRLASLANDTGADEIMLATAIYDPVARQRSLELLAKAAS